MITAIRLLLLAFLFSSIAPAFAENRRDYTIHRKKDVEFEEVFADLEDAIINQGLVIDYVGHINDMINRTAAAAAADADDTSPYLNAKFVQFCSSKLTHEAIRISPHNLATCPYVIFVYQTRQKPQHIVVGYRNPELGIPGPTRFVVEKIDKLIKDVVADTLSD